MNWIEFLRDIGIFGIVTFAIQKFIENSNNKKLETYKNELDYTIRSYQLNLDTNLERYKSDLNLHFNRQTSLHGKRLFIIDEMYKKIVPLDSAMRAMIGIHIIVEDGEKEQLERVTKSQKAFADFNNYYLLNKLYFNKETSELLERIRKEYISANWDFFELKRLHSFTGGQISQEGHLEAFEKVKNASKRITDDIPTILETLEEEFRKLIGVN